MDKDSERPRLLTLEEIADLLELGPLAGHDIAAAWNQTAFRGFADDGVPGSATALAAENANWTQDTDVNFRVRFEFEETANASPPVIPSIQLQYNLNGAGWNNVNASSSVVRSFGSAHYADNDADNNDRLTTGARTFLEGRMDEGVAGGSGVAFFTGSFNNEQGEFETCIQIRSADVSDADTVQLRLVHQTGPTPFGTYTNTPSITVNIPTGSVTVTVPVATLTLTTFVPVVKSTIIVPVASLTLTTFAPTPRLGTIVTVPVASLSLTTFAPTAAVSNNITVTVPVAALSLSTFAPVIESAVIVPVASLTLSTFAPTVTVGINVTVPVASLSLTTFAPTVLAPRTVTVPVASLSLTTFAPTVTAGGSQVVTVPVASLSLTTFAPTVTASSGVTVTVPVAALSLTTFTPAVQTPRTVTVPVATLTLATFGPTALVRVTVTVPVATLSLGTFAPTVTATANVYIIVPVASLMLTGYAPSVIGAIPSGPNRRQQFRQLPPPPSWLRIQDYQRVGSFRR